MRVLFVYPNVNCQIGFNYGVASLSAVLRTKGHETELLNLNEKLAPVPGPREIAARIIEWQPDLVGFSVVTTQFPLARRIAEALREVSDVPVVFGGVHATMVPEEVMALDAVDYACVGEAEESLSELVEVLVAGGDPARIRGVWSKRGGETVRNPVRPLPDLGSLPQKDYEVFDFQRMIDAKDGWVGLMASRGCPYRCTYCFNHEMFSRYKRELGVPAAAVHYVRHHPVEAVLAEIRHLLETYTGIEMFIFDDDLFTHDKEYLLRFCRAYRDISSVPLTVNAHVLRFDADIAGALKAAGTRLVKFGIESGSPRIRKEVLNRHMSNEAIRRALATAHEAGLETSAFLMFGLPREGRAEVEETIRLLAEGRPTRLRWSIFYPFPGTRAHRLAEEDGSIDPAKMAGLQNFFEESALRFGPEHDLYIRKLRRTLPWEVNALVAGEAAPLYRQRLDEIARLSPDEWSAFEPGFLGLDRSLSDELSARGVGHYAIRFNEFMAVWTQEPLPEAP
jgi:radical SAM superfamily enzyme YgiQ (UPF0313 family)